MKLRRIAVQNLRRFTAPAEITDLADGLNVLSAPNEQGKSTLFDGLQALFFTAHNQKPKEINALKPHAGGAPEVLAEVETDQGQFTVAKRWLSKPRAQILQNGRLIAQADAAEEWITRLAAADAGGPAGLLWVRQGLTGFDESGKKAQDMAREARRDLLSSIAGEVDTMTGGARMDAALKRCREELGRYVTATGRPLKTGPWKAVQDRVEKLQAALETHEQIVAELQNDLSARSRARNELKDLTDPEGQQHRKARLEAATAAQVAAERHALELDRLTRATETARLRLEGLETRRKTRAAALVERDTAAQSVASAEAVKTEAETAQRHAETEAAEARTTLQQTRKALTEAETALRAAQTAERALEAAQQRQELDRRIAQAEALQAKADAARRDVAKGPAPEAMTRIDRLVQARDQARALQAASAARLEITYEAGRDGTVTRQGHALPGGTAVPLLQAEVLEVAGVGHLRFMPGGTDQEGATAEAEEALAAALAALNLPDVDAARAAARQRADAERRLSETTAGLRALAPDGLEDLRSRLAALPAPASEDAPTPLPLPEAEAQRSKAEAARQAAEIRFETARDRLEAARTAQARSQSDALAAADRLDRAGAALAQTAETSDAELEAARQALATAEAEQSAAQADAPDLALTQAALTRARSAHEAAEHRIAQLNLDLARLDERVRRSAEGAVEERLEELRQDLAIAQTDLARITRDVAVLKRLETVLEAARIAARDKYFTPVANALRPLLHLLWPEAQLDWDDADLLPRRLIRHGQEEAMDILSGGTQEQLALLVRLAFARLLAQDGRAAPVILDDALVYTDDDRIEKMFDALHRQASDVQILVLTCRQRAFRDLGGQQLQIRPLSPAPDSLLDL
ncbi:chromosome segregation protein SMC [Mameliella alba]|nr:chromosome segregation protein SMC [Mameliella alba]MBY6171584.1 chromosome segregation protein SMC [Mameliella alba]MBY6176809.1 chromosome segregation protein SMC [Mameliella alba]